MANPEHVRILKQGVEVWNAWRRAHPDAKIDLFSADLREIDHPEANFAGANLSRADLSRADLPETDFTGADLSGANLSGANFYKAIFVEANLTGAYLAGTNLPGADFSKTDLPGAYLTKATLSHSTLTGAYLPGATLIETTLTGSDLSGADLTGVYLRETIFSNTLLKNTKGLRTCKHIGPSTLDYRTLQLSWPLPQVFLRGCGLPDEYIKQLSSLLDNIHHFYSCFISYARKDEAFAQRLHADLHDSGVLCWFAPEKMKGGQKLQTQLAEAIRRHDKLILILSEHSMESDWVAYEIKQARKREKREGRQTLFPVSTVPYKELEDWELFHRDSVTDLAEEIRSYYIPDFTRWKEHDAYQKALGELLKGLKAEG